jgi:hypothetical protein
MHREAPLTRCFEKKRTGALVAPVFFLCGVSFAETAAGSNGYGKMNS